MSDKPLTPDETARLRAVWEAGEHCSCTPFEGLHVEDCNVLIYDQVFTDRALVLRLLDLAQQASKARLAADSCCDCIRSFDSEAHPNHDDECLGNAVRAALAQREDDKVKS